MQSQLQFPPVRVLDVTMARKLSLLQVQKHLFQILQDLPLGTLKVHRPLDFPGVLSPQFSFETALVEKALQVSVGALLQSHESVLVSMNIQILVGAHFF